VIFLRTRRVDSEVALALEPTVLSVTSPAPRAAWREILAADPTATVCQTPEWLDAICRSSPYRDASRLYECSDGRWFVLPLARRSFTPDALAVQASPPAYWSTGGLVAAGGVRAADVTAVWDDVLTDPVAGTRIRPYYLAAPVWAAATPRSVRAVDQEVHVLDLAGGFDEVWSKRFAAATRRAVRKAEASRLDVVCDTSGGQMRTLHEIYQRWLRQRAQDSGIPAALVVRRNAMRDSLAKYEAVGAALGANCRVWIARLDGVPVAALVVLVHGEHALYWRGYSERDLSNPVRANNLLQRLAIEDACASGCRFYNMGESGGVDSLVDFKERHGARPESFRQYDYERLPYSRFADVRSALERRVGALIKHRRRPRAVTQPARSVMNEMAQPRPAFGSAPHDGGGHA
jgi:hypothetical protein